MVLGLAGYLYGRRWLPAQSSRAGLEIDKTKPLSSRQWRTVLLLFGIVPLIGASQVGNQQMFNAFLVWGKTHFNLHLAGFEMPVTWLLSADAALSSILLAMMIAFWSWCRVRGCEPDAIVKIGIGAALLALAPLLLALASLQIDGGGKVSIGWGIAFEVINELGFVIMIPANLALFSTAPPKSVQGVMLGVYFLAFLFANLTVGWLGGLLDQMHSTSFWLLHSAIVGTAAVMLAAAAKWGRGILTPD